MNINLQQIISNLILAVGMIFFLFVAMAKEFMFSLIIASFTLISWIFYQIIVSQKINYKKIGNVIFLSGIIIGIAIFFVFGVEQVAYPAGSVKFKASGIAKSLAVILFSMLPALMFYIVEDSIPTISSSKKIKLPQKTIVKKEEKVIEKVEYNEDEWEEVSEDELTDQEYELT
mgnify:CR=1 FL=1